MTLAITLIAIELALTWLVGLLDVLGYPLLVMSSPHLAQSLAPEVTGTPQREHRLMSS